ncbi:MAG: DEAD/DEAH box helicase [Firmicutes bacterium]|nr:DEAD/DEAH box helicase [Bacillota bacterium]
MSTGQIQAHIQAGDGQIDDVQTGDVQTGAQAEDAQADMQVQAETSVAQAGGQGARTPPVETGTPVHGAPAPYRGLTLDDFQREAIGHLLAGRSVLVSAPTGSGKTLVADYLIDQVIRRGSQAIYTAPIKALSNQKYKDFKFQYGPDNVGIVTGDIVINDTAPILVMTTEILRNILHTDIHRLAGVSHVIFDEIHYIGDEERGSVWEEAIIFLPRHIRILGLSATIPNAPELADWMSETREEEVKVVRHSERPVPLAHYLFEKGAGAGSLQDIARAYKRQRKKARYGLLPSTSHIDLVRHLTPDLLPCLYFLFSRQQCEIKARELAQVCSFLANDERREVKRFFDEKMEGSSAKELPTSKALRRALVDGIGFHHAGLLPILKEIVEELFARRKIAVLYCTETFAVGVNLPVRSVCFDSPEKFDGFGYRPMTNQEYFQMAGRAGRRGVDRQGYVFTLVDLNYFDKEQFPVHEEKKLERLASQFRLSYNTVLNLVARYTREEVETLLDKSFAAYQRRRRAGNLMAEIEAIRARRDELASKSRHAIPSGHATQAGQEAALSGRATRAQGGAKRLRRLDGRLRRLEAELSSLPATSELMAEFEAKVRLLKRLGYIAAGTPETGAGAFAALTEKGAMASRINVQELLVTELISGEFFHRLDEDQVNALAVAVDYQPRREGARMTRAPFDLEGVQAIIRRIQRAEYRELGLSTVVFDPSISHLAYAWSRGAGFGDLMQLARFGPVNMDEGDVVSALRRGIDLLRQVKLACTGDPDLLHKINRCMDKMDRDVVRVDL